MWCQARRELLWQNIDGVCGPRPRPGRHAERERPGRFENAYLRQARPPTKRIEDPVSVNDIRRGRTAGLDSGKLKHPHPAPAFNTVRKPSRETPAAHARALAASAGARRLRGRAATHRAPAATRQKCRPRMSPSYPLALPRECSRRPPTRGAVEPPRELRSLGARRRTPLVASFRSVSSSRSISDGSGVVMLAVNQKALISSAA